MTNHRPFTILGIDHLGIAPRDTEQSRCFFSAILQLQLLGVESIASEAVQVSMLASSHQEATPAPAPRLELLAPLSADSPISNFLEKKSGGIHHLAFRVDHIRAAVTYLLQAGVLLINREPRPGAHGSEVVFVHPKSTGGILVELVAKVSPSAANK